ncbi:MAG TPA: PP2C family protein-serine/threonine phosphatase [Bryobacteraceae bacterium]|jgi:hypothetical protein
MKPPRSRQSYFKFAIVLTIGAVLALVLCIQCVRTYLYTDAVLVPQQAEREAERQGGALSTAARSAGIGDPHALLPVIEHALESASERVLWIRVLDPGEGTIIAQGGNPQTGVHIPKDWWKRIDNHESLGKLVDTARGKAFVALMPFRMPRPPRPVEATRPAPGPGPGGHRGGGMMLLEVAIPINAVHGAFDGLRQNLIVGLIASVALLLALAVIGLRAPRYLRGRYLEGELQLAKRVQGDLQPKPRSIPPCVEFAASAVAADHVGGDFYDIFETDSGKVVIVLGDVSGKGVSAALLVSVIQGAIRSSSVSQLATACERINRMLCERTACERFATLFWGVFDPGTGTLDYVNAGHAAPMLIERGSANPIDRLAEGGPVLGILPAARYVTGTVKLDDADTLVLYSDGINEAENEHGEEFGEDRVAAIVASAAPGSATEETCERIMNRVQTFSRSGAAADDRTLLLVRFPGSGISVQSRQRIYGEVKAVA